MDYILKIKAKFDCEILLNSKNYNLNLDDEISFKLTLLNNENANIKVRPINTSLNKESLNYDVEIFSENNTLKIVSNNVKIYVLKNEYTIELYNDVIIKDINIIYSSNSIFAYNTIKTHLLNKNINLELPECFSSIETKKFGNISAFEFSNNENKYLVLLNNSKVLFSDFFNETKFEKSILKILSNINDIAKHSKLTIIDTLSNTKTEEFVYIKKEPKLIKNDKLIPLAFLQALKVKNIKLMKFYLSENLKEVGTLQNYLDFFGNFKKCTFNFEDNITANLFYPTKISNVFSGKSFEFNIVNNKINKITQNNL